MSVRRFCGELFDATSHSADSGFWVQVSRTPAGGGLPRILEQQSPRYNLCPKGSRSGHPFPRVVLLRCDHASVPREPSKYGPPGTLLGRNFGLPGEGHYWVDNVRVKVSLLLFIYYMFGTLYSSGWGYIIGGGGGGLLANLQNENWCSFP